MASSAHARTLRSLADDLRSRSAGQITRLLRERPDLLHPWPSDLGHLARRAADDASVLEAMQGLTTPQLRVLEVFACLHEATIEDVVGGLPDDEQQVRAAVSALWDRALLWGGPDVLRIARAAQQAFGPYPCGLAAATGSGPGDAATIREVAAGTDPEILRTWVWDDPVHPAPHPLLVMRGEQYAMARETSLLLREGQYLRAAHAPADPEPVQPGPGHGMWTPVAGVRYLLGDLSREPLPVHPVRGASRRVLIDRAAAMAVPVDDLQVWLELAAGAELVGLADDRCRPTPLARTWLHQPPPRMWMDLIGPWLDGDRPLGRCVPEDLGCLTTATVPRTAAHRSHILSVWPPQARVDADEMRALVAWYRPRMHEAIDQVGAVAHELHVLGLIEAGVPTRALAELPDDVPSAAEHLPAAVAGDLIVQPDHTVIAPLWVDTPTWELMQAVARVESWGPVTMQRIDPGRLRQAVARRRPDDLLTALSAASRTPVPQSVEYAIGDAGRASPVRVYPATVVETSGEDSEALRGLGLSEVTPTMFTSDQSPEVVTRLLTAAGVATEREEAPQVAVPLDRGQGTSAPDPATVTRLVAHLMAGDRTVDLTAPALSPADPDTLAHVCRLAITDDRRMWVEYADSQGAATDLLEPIDLRGGRLTGWSLTGGRMVTVTLARIAAYRSLDD